MRHHPNRKLHRQIYMSMLLACGVALTTVMIASAFHHPAVGAIVGFVAVGVLSIPVAMRITWRLRALERAADAWGEGDLRRRVQIGGNDEIASLAAAFNRAAERVETLVDGQRRVLATASHELRSPLARLRVAMELMEGDDATRLAAAQEIAELDGLIEEVLVASRLDARPAVERADVELLALAAEEAARAGAAVEGDVLTVSGDARLLRRMLRNLIENARRYGENVVVTVSATAGGARVVVEDDGPGVPDAERERIFEPWFRVSGHREGSGGGVGLGLALTRQIAAHHAGTIRYEPGVSGGSRFVVELPRSPV